jgi:hypothetical protein
MSYQTLPILLKLQLELHGVKCISQLISALVKVVNAHQAELYMVHQSVLTSERERATPAKRLVKRPPAWG